VFLIVGRLIGLEPAREMLARATPAELVVPLALATDDGERAARLRISPGAAGTNTFTLELDGRALPPESEGVLRFAFPSQDIGSQELLLPAVDGNRFRGEGPELALPGDWQLAVVVRRIGAFSWRTDVVVPIPQTPPPVPTLNPAPRFGPAGVGAMVAVAMGIAGIASALARRGTDFTRRRAMAAIGAVLVAGGTLALAAARLPAAPAPGATVVQRDAAMAGSPVVSSPEVEAAHDHATPASAPAMPRTGSGTPVSAGTLTVTLQADPKGPGAVELTIGLTDPAGAPVAGARVVVVSEMPGMAMDRTETPATETSPGRYVVEAAPLGMRGTWAITARVSPRGEPTEVVGFQVTVP
jgi:hypothetical protein